MVQHGLDHVQMRDQDGLREVGGKVVVGTGLQMLPEARRGFAQGLRTELVQVQPGLDAVEKLIGPELAHGNRAHQLLKRFLAQAEEDVGKLHSL